MRQLFASWFGIVLAGRNERAGNTGISHWVEHLMFNGTPSFPSGEFWTGLYLVKEDTGNAFYLA